MNPEHVALLTDYAVLVFIVDILFVESSEEDFYYNGSNLTYFQFDESELLAL